MTQRRLKGGAAALARRAASGDPATRLGDVAGWIRPRKPQLRDGYIVWPAPSPSPLDGFAEMASTNKGDGLLGEFVSLRKSRKDDSDVLFFARKWGVLSLCNHELPRRHSALIGDRRGVERALLGHRWAELGLRSAPPGKDMCGVSTSGEGWCQEPVSAWRRIAEALYSIGAAAADERSSSPPSRRVWETIDSRLGYLADPGFFPTSVRLGRHLDGSPTQPLPMRPPQDQMSLIVRTHLAVLIDGLMRLGDVRLAFRWSDPLPEPSLEVDGVFGALVADLALLASGATGFSLCSGCDEFYAPTRRPAPGKRHYCTTCQERGVPERDAQRDYRERKRLAPRAGGTDG